MQKAVQDFLFGLCFGMGFAIAVAVLRFIGGLISSAEHPKIVQAAFDIAAFSLN